MSEPDWNELGPEIDDIIQSKFKNPSEARFLNATHLALEDLKKEAPDTFIAGIQAVMVMVAMTYEALDDRQEDTKNEVAIQILEAIGTWLLIQRRLEHHLEEWSPER